MMNRSTVVALLYVLNLGLLSVCAAPAERGQRTEPVATPCSRLSPGDYDRTIRVGGAEREYRLHVPPVASGEARRALVMVFHGGGQSGPRIQELIRMDSTSDENGFLVAYPTGTRGPAGGYTWNGGDCCGAAMRKRIDDVGFVEAMIDDLVAEGCVDPERVYATGISNGAIFVYRLGCELSDKIAAIAPIAGALMMKVCNPKRTVPAIIFHGTADQEVKVEGGRNLISGARRAFPPLDETRDRWLKINGCTLRSQVSFQKGDSTCRIYQGCASTGPVTLCTIAGGGHTWPGGEPFRSDRLGYTSQDLSANEEMWDFFQHNPLSHPTRPKPEILKREPD